MAAFFWTLRFPADAGGPRDDDDGESRTGFDALPVAGDGSVSTRQFCHSRQLVQYPALHPLWGIYLLRTAGGDHGGGAAAVSRLRFQLWLRDTDGAAAHL